MEHTPCILPGLANVDEAARIPAMAPFLKLLPPLRTSTREVVNLPLELEGQWMNHFPNQIMLLEYIRDFHLVEAGLMERDRLLWLYDETIGDLWRPEWSWLKDQREWFPDPTDMKDWRWALHELLDRKLIAWRSQRGKDIIPWKVTRLGVSRLDLEQRLLRCHLYATAIRSRLLEEWPKVGGKPSKAFLIFRDEKGQTYSPEYETLFPVTWTGGYGRQKRLYLENTLRDLPDKIANERNYWRALDSAPPKVKEEEQHKLAVRKWEGYADRLKRMERAITKKARLYYDPAPYIDWVWCNRGDLPMMDSPFLQEASLKEAELETRPWNVRQETMEAPPYRSNPAYMREYPDYVNYAYR